MKVKCKFCGNEFEGKKDRKYCSPYCFYLSVNESQQKYRQLKKEMLTN